MVGSMEVGIAWFMMLLGLGGGVPVGLPPAAEEPFMFQIAPDECLFFTSWVSMAEIDDSSDHPTEKFVAEPELQALLAKSEAAIRLTISRSSRGSGSLQMLATEILPDFVKLILTRATTVYVDEFEMRDEAPHISGAVVVSLGPHEEKIREHTSVFLEAVANGNIFPQSKSFKIVTIGGSKFSQVKIEEGDNLVTWGIQDSRLIIAFGDGHIEQLLANARTPMPEWLASQKSELSVDRIAAISYLNLASITSLIDRNLPEERDVQFIRDQFEAWGLMSFESLQIVSGFDESGVVDRTRLKLKEGRKGVFASIGNKPLDPERVNRLPSDPLFAYATQIDLKQIYEMIQENPAMVGSPDEGAFRMAIGQVEAVIGGDLKSDLIDSLGDAVYLFTASNDGGLVTGWTLAIDLEDSDKINRIMQRIIGFTQAARMMGGGGDFLIRSQKVADHEVYYLQMGRHAPPINFSFAMVNDQLLLSLYPQAIKGQIARMGRDDGLGTNASVSAAVQSNASNGMLTAVSYVDMQEVIRQAYPLLLIGATALQSEFPAESDLTVADIPSVQSLTRHLKPAVSVTHADANSYTTVNHHVLPTGTIGTSAPTITALLLPAVSSARMAARRTTSANNLKQIGIALHNYHDVFKSMPAAYRIDEAGQPLLSWRVYILPFIEQQGLFEQFHLDEPWDSENNIKLVSRMPSAYQLPGQSSDEGKTVYQGVAGEGGMFGTEAVGERAKEKFPLGNRLMDVVDGTSNTIIVVETNMANAVTWTRPEDFQAPEMQPVERLIGNWGDVFNVLMGDASVQALSKDIDPDLLRKMFTIADHDFPR